MESLEVLKKINDDDFVTCVKGADKTGVPLYGVEATDACILSILAGTNCPKGGDGGHGGRTILLIKDLGGTVMSLDVNGKEVSTDLEEMRLVLHGDAECRVFIQAMDKTIRLLKDQLQENRDKEKK